MPDVRPATCAKEHGVVIGDRGGAAGRAYAGKEGKREKKGNLFIEKSRLLVRNVGSKHDAHGGLHPTYLLGRSGIGKMVNYGTNAYRSACTIHSV